MALLDLIRSGSFGGAPFLFKRGFTAGGRKQVKHEFPNSDKQSIEDLGFLPKTFNMEVQTTFDPDDETEESYFANRDALIFALEQGGEQLLSHPFFNTDILVVARPYIIEEDLTELGVANFRLVFDFSDEGVNPLPEGNALSIINQNANSCVAQVNTDIAEKHNVSTGFNLTSSVSVVQSFINDVKTQTGKVTQVADDINEFNSSLNSFQQDIVEIVQAPQKLADAIIGTVTSTRALYASVDSALDVFVRFFDFGDNFDIAIGNTRETEEQQTNQDVVVSGVQAAYLAEAYQAASTKEYTTDLDVDEIKQTLEAQFDKVTAFDITNDLSNELSDLRTSANSFLNAQRLTARSVIDVRTNEIPIRVLAYAYYGVDDNTTTNSIIDLNDTADISFIEGEIKILSAS